MAAAATSALVGVPHESPGIARNTERSLPNRYRSSLLAADCER
jgi:hypothetical protein